MPKVFVSSERADEPYVAALIDKLRANQFEVAHSPRNPLDGRDERWRDWYARGLEAELDDVSVFLIVITPGWDASTWMAIEADVALQKMNTGCLGRMSYYNPAHIKTGLGTMQKMYLKEQLPDGLDELIAELTSADKTL